MNRVPDPTAPGRPRRLVLAVLPPLLVAVPVLLVERRPAGWDETVWGNLTPVLTFQVLLLLAFVREWRVPRTQRWLAVGGFAVFASLAVPDVLRLAAGGAVASWHVPAAIAATVAAAGLAWLSAGPLPPEASAPEVSVTSGWVRRRMVTAVVLAGAAGWVLSDGVVAGAWQTGGLLLLLAGAEVAKAYPGLRIGGQRGFRPPRQEA